MLSRYSYMRPGKVQDSVDKDFYPDVLSIDYSNGVIQKIPTLHRITSADISKFWKYMWDRYGILELDDLLLSINGFPYLGMLEPGSELYELSLEDITGYMENKKIGEDPDWYTS